METPTGILEVGVTTSVLVSSRIGCREVIRCLGNGTRVVWKRFGVRNPITSGGNRVITVSHSAICAVYCISHSGALLAHLLWWSDPHNGGAV